jgi:rhodanese-related sulfurtransferase
MMVNRAYRHAHRNRQGSASRGMARALHAKGCARDLLMRAAAPIAYDAVMRTLLLAMLCLVPLMVHAEVLTPDQAKALADRGELTIIDIRLPAEWAQTGVPEGALAISLQDQSLQPRAEFVADVLQALGDHPDQPIALICARGHRSAYAQQLLAQEGFTRVHDISEGMLGGEFGPGWLQRDLATEPCPTC